MKTLNRSLSSMFSPAKARPAPDRAYPEFRRRVRELRLTYKVARDSYIELRDTAHRNVGVFPHYGDWAETLDRLNSMFGESR